MGDLGFSFHTTWWFYFLSILSTPHWRVDVSGGRLTPIVIVVVPTVKVDEESALVDLSDGSHTNQGRILTVFCLHLHAGSEQQAPRTSQLLL